MRWRPKEGHVPRGFRGALGRLSDVELVLVMAEPGTPERDESYPKLNSPGQLLKIVYDRSMSRLDKSHSAFGDDWRGNLRAILDLCWPRRSFRQQMKKVWITNAVLCSALKAGGHISNEVSRTCGNNYLRKQLALFPNALVVALGDKAARRLRAVGSTHFLSTLAITRPITITKSDEALISWKRIPIELRRRQRNRS